MKKQIFVFAFSAAILTALFAAACGGVLEAAPEAGGGISGGKGRVIISISGAGDLAPEEAAESAAAAPRTLLPEPGDLEYTLEFTRDGETEPALTRTITTAGFEQDLDSGGYTLKVSAYKAGTDEAVAEGIAEFEVSMEQSTDVTVTLALCQTGTGSLDYSVALPGGMALIKGSLTLYPLSGGADPVNIDLSAGLSGSEEVSAGYYRARLSLYGVVGGAEKFAAKTAVLHIAVDTRTTASYAPDSGEFIDSGLYEPYTAGNAAELAAAFNSIRAAAGTVFSILATEDFSSPPVILADAGYGGKIIILRGADAPREISLDSRGSLFTVDAAASGLLFILKDITLKGLDDNDAALVKLDGGALIMEDGALVTGNTNSAAGSSSYGGGVYVAENSSFTMQGGASVSGNTASSSSPSYGGGVYIAGGTFTMQGGASVSGNTASGPPSSNSISNGGGVYVAGGTCTMQDSASGSGITS
jgi:hypothetical protein